MNDIGTTAADALVEPRMASAGAELTALAWRLKDHPDFKSDHERVLEIGCWISMERTTDIERGLIEMLGPMVGAMRRRGFSFRDDQPIATQFRDFLDGIPGALPDQAGYVDQTALALVDRRDTFVADICPVEVRRWTSGDQVDHAVAPECAIVPRNGIACSLTVHASGDEACLLREGEMMPVALRASGNALRVVPMELVSTTTDGETGTQIAARVQEMADYLASDRNDAAWPEQIDKPGSATRTASARDLAALVAMATRIDVRGR